MSARRKSKPIFGPDGKPLDRAKYATQKPAEPAPAPTAPTSLSDFLASDTIFLDPLRWWGVRGVDPATPKGPSLAERVANDLVALGIDTTDTVAELPRPEPDLTAYADALEHAIKTCPHKDVTSTMYARGEYQCQDCHKYLSSADMRKRSGGTFGFFL